MQLLICEEQRTLFGQHSFMYFEDSHELWPVATTAN